MTADPIKVVGVGVDLINPMRIRTLIASHPKRFYQTLLSPAEKKRYSFSKWTPVLASKLFAAKEAFFKATGASWLGVQGFADIEVFALPNSQFKVKSHRFGRSNYQAVGTFFKAKSLVGAQVILFAV